MRRIAILCAAAFTLCFAPASAQRLWLPPDATRNIGFEIQKGFFRSGSPIEFASFSVDVQGRFPLNNKLALTVGVPYTRFAQSNSNSISESETAIGNPWIGIEMPAWKDVVIEAGVRPGLAKGADIDALLLGTMDDFDHFEAWLPEATSLRGMAHMGHVPDAGSYVTGNLGATVVIAHAGEVDLYANYGIRGNIRDHGRVTSLALTGRARLTHSGSLDQRTVHQLTFAVEAVEGRFRPRASLGTYLDKGIRENLKALLTLGAAVVF